MILHSVSLFEVSQEEIITRRSFMKSCFRHRKMKNLDVSNCIINKLFYLFELITILSLKYISIFLSKTSEHWISISLDDRSWPALSLVTSPGLLLSSHFPCFLLSRFHPLIATENYSFFFVDVQQFSDTWSKFSGVPRGLLFKGNSSFRKAVVLIKRKKLLY